ncbi:nicotinate-nucleotide adenylyltransferase [Verrucomicrobia bacterium S94]|nr:nicotinate-nucleotide adenylyltransferase [Verrucomicrobia bacterium S94]
MDEQAPVSRVGLFGGSFDPVHNGHLIIAQDAVEKLELDQVIFIPASIPPHKTHLQQASAEHRLKMLTLAVKNDLRFSVSDIEIRRGGISYSVDTVNRLVDELPEAELFFIVGSDTLVDLHNWYRIDEIMSCCEIASFLRPGEDDFTAIEQKVGLAEPLRQRVLANTFESHMVDISSSEIRMRVAEGLGIRYLVPAEVEMYIFEHGLYQG